MTVENELSTATVDTFAPNPGADTTVDTSDAEMGAAFDKIMGEDTARDESGRFAAKQALLKGEDGAGDNADSSTVSEDAPAPDTVTGTSAPEHLPQSIKAEWQNMPETARAAIAKHQAEMDRRFGEIGGQLRMVKPVADRLFEATTKFPEFAGMTPERLAQGALELAAVQTRLNKAPLDTILEIAQHYGVLAPLQQKLSGQQVTVPNGPNFAAMERKIAELESQLSEKASPEYIRQQVSALTEEQAAESAVKAFATGKEFWPDVQHAMPQFFEMAMTANPNATETEALELAYDMAINALPAVRAKVLASGARSNTATVDDLATKRTDAAKKAASINVKPSSTGKERQLSEDDAMASAYDRAMAS